MYSITDSPNPKEQAELSKYIIAVETLIEKNNKMTKTTSPVKETCLFFCLFCLSSFSAPLKRRPGHGCWLYCFPNKTNVLMPTVSFAYIW